MIDLEIKVKVTVDIIICLDTFNDYIAKISPAKKLSAESKSKNPLNRYALYSGFYGIKNEYMIKILHAAYAFF